MLLITTLIAWFVNSALAVEIGAEAEFVDFVAGALLGRNDCDCGHNYLSEYRAE